MFICLYDRVILEFGNESVYITLSNNDGIVKNCFRFVFVLESMHDVEKKSMTGARHDLSALQNFTNPTTSRQQLQS